MHEQSSIGAEKQKHTKARFVEIFSPFAAGTEDPFTLQKHTHSSIQEAQTDLTCTYTSAHSSFPPITPLASQDRTIEEATDDVTYIEVLWM